MAFLTDNTGNLLVDNTGNLLFDDTPVDPAELRVYVDWDNDAHTSENARPTDPANLLPSPVLWTDLTFAAQGAADLTIRSETTNLGLHVLRVACSTGTIDGLILGHNTTPPTEIAASPNTQYTLALWARGVTDYTGLALVLEVLDQDLFTLASTTFTLSPVWQQIALPFATGSPDSALIVRLYKSNSARPTVFDLTGLMLVAASSAPPVFNAGPTARYDNITPYVQNAQWQAGRAAVDDLMPGPTTATLRLVNTTRLFSPDFTDSPLYGFVKPGRRVRLDLLHTGGATTLWHGWIAGITVGTGRYAAPFVTLQCQGSPARLQQAPVPIGLQQNQRADEIAAVALATVIAAPTLQHYWLLDSATRSVLDRTTALYASAEQLDSQPGKSVFTFAGDSWHDYTTVWAALAEIVAAEQAVFWQNRDGRLTLRNRHFWASTPIPHDTATDADLHAADYAWLEPLSAVAITCYPRQASPATVVLWQQHTPTRVEPATTTVIQARVTSAEGVQVAALSVLHPVAGLDFAAVDSDGDDVTELISVKVQNRGATVLISIRNPRRKTYHLTTLQVRGTILHTFNAALVRETDPAALVEYGRRELALELRALDDAHVARDYARFILHERSAPRAVLANLTLTGQAAGVSKMVAWQFGTRLRISEYQAGGGTADYFIVGERFQMTAPHALQAVYLLLPAARLAFWQLDTAALDTATVPAY